MPAYQEKNRKTWYVKFRYKDYTGTIKHKTKRGFVLRRDAVEWEHTFLANLDKTPARAFSELSRAYLEDKRINLKKISYETKKNRIDTWITPTFSTQAIGSITPADVREWENSLNTATSKKGEPLSDNYKQNLVTELSSIFNFAIKFYGLRDNPVRIAGNTAGKKTKRCDFWTLDQFRQFLDTFGERDAYYYIFQTLYWTGCRLGELLALTVADVLPDRIRISKTFHVINGEPVITAPKTKKSIRDIYITPQLSALLEEYKGKLYQPRSTDRLFPYGDTTIAKHFKDHARSAGLPEIRLHDIRHSHASLLINQGADALLVSERLGHENVTTTLSIYSHLFPSRQTEITDKLTQIWPF